VKGQASYTDLDLSGGYNNVQIANFLSPNQDIGARVMPAIGLEYRFPLVAATDWGTSVFEPIGQVIARPPESRIGHLPNEDAQSLVFDDTNLFSWDKFSGYDRMEGGTRANVGAQYTFTTKSGASLNILGGQSYQLAGPNSFAQGDLANTGLDSGLDKKHSDFVGRIQVQPVPWFTSTLRGRFDESDFAAKRLEITSSFYPFQAVDWFGDSKQMKSFSLTASYAHLDAQPDLGQFFRRNALNVTGNWNFWDDWSATAGVTFDLSAHLVPTQVITPVGDLPALHYSHGLFEPYSTVLALQYKNDCCTLTGQYVTGYAVTSGGYHIHDETVLFTLELRTLGAFSYSSDVTSLYNSVDGIGANGR
jgi:LPS-assembly protein